MAKYQSAYASRVQTGATALLTPSQAREYNTSERIASRPRPSYRDDIVTDDLLDESDGESPSQARTQSQQQKERQRPQEVVYDERGYVIDMPEEATKLQTRNKSWIRVRPDHILERAAQTAENLIPIRLDLDLGGHKLKDAFLWNLNEELVTPTEFAVNLCQDLGLANSHVDEIARDVRKQLEEYAPVANTTFAPPGKGGPAELNVIVELEVHLARHLLTDKFEWNVLELGGVEDFARTTCEDLGLFGEFVNSLSCAIREQLIRLKKELGDQAQAGKADIWRQAVDNDAAYDEPAGIRVCPETLGLEWVPSIDVMTREDIERRDGERDRELRRLRREASRFGLTAPIATGPRKRRAQEEAELLATGGMLEHERSRWKCAWCRISGLDTWQIKGRERELCVRCWSGAERNDGQPEEWRRSMFSTRSAVNNRP